MMFLLFTSLFLSNFLFDLGCSKSSGQSRGTTNVRRYTVVRQSKGCILNIVWWYEKETMVIPLTPFDQNLILLEPDVNWTYVRRSEDVQDFFWKPYVCSIYVLRPRGILTIWNALKLLRWLQALVALIYWETDLLIDLPKDKNPLDTGRKLNLHETFRRRPEPLTERLVYAKFTSCVQGVNPFMHNVVK